MLAMERGFGRGGGERSSSKEEIRYGASVWGKSFLFTFGIGQVDGWY